MTERDQALQLTITTIADSIVTLQQAKDDHAEIITATWDAFVNEHGDKGELRMVKKVAAAFASATSSDFRDEINLADYVLTCINK